MQIKEVFVNNYLVDAFGGERCTLQCTAQACNGLAEMFSIYSQIV